MIRMQSSILEIKSLLGNEELEKIDKLLSGITFEDGKKTATGAAKEAKTNLQAQGSNARRDIQQLILGAISKNSLIRASAMPKAVLPPIISKYNNGMNYGWHTDSPIMTIEYTIRVDLSITVFLSDPATYTGGELEIEMPGGNVLYKLNKGGAIIYPTTKLHRVRPVTDGERVAAVTWMQSLVKDTAQREILFQLQSLQEAIAAKDLSGPENIALLQVYSNLVRMWTDL
ncbi:MAG: Fe2+-dependent dioxygenase [Chitinophagaceae bacterium]|nr:Fe2+-dependent dioxygenase [Chitinophagaceae bacterium]MCB9044671.1 Fe2+-dependent dioxygenase [Chitinophagales bacterium]